MAQQIKRKKYLSKFPMMGTIISLTLFEKNEPAVFEVYDYLQKMDRVFSANRQDSELAKINQNAGIRPTKVSKTCFELIDDAVKYSKKYSDSFNVLIGPLVKTWKIGFGGQRIPEKSEIESTLKLMDPGKVVLNSKKLTVYLTKPKMQFDLGAIAKGYFADQIASRLTGEKITNGIINLGGNVQTWGENPLSKSGIWEIGIRDPKFEDNRVLTTVRTAAKTFVTSGIRERYFKIGDKIYHHILNPQTGYPKRSDLVQVTIITDNSELAEVLSTVCFFKGSERGVQFINHFPNAEAIFVTQGNQLVVTDGLKKVREGVYDYESKTY